MKHQVRMPHGQDTTAPTRPWLERRALAPVDVASLVAFRAIVGALVFVASARFLVNGWVERFFVKPDFTFKFWGFAWVEVLPPWAMHVVFVAMAVLGLMVAAGLFYRVAVVALFILFTYVELLDVTNYLNHYYLVSLHLFLLCCLPLHRAGSLDVWRRPSLRVDTLPAWMVWLLRFQVGAVYFYAAVAKFSSDWLLHAQPLNIWLAARTETPLIGSLFRNWWVALAMSWGGFLNDLIVPFALLHRRSRPWAYTVVVVFHILTGWLFNIGMFPLIMITSALIFFSPDWPRRVLRLLNKAPRRATPPQAAERDDAAAANAETSPAAAAQPLWMMRPALALCTFYVLVQVLMPWRFVLYGGDVLWHEQGMRWSWRVMVREKNGSVTYKVHLPRQGRTRLVSPRRYLTDQQEREMSGQPDLILQLAHHIGQEFRDKGHPRVEVRVDAQVSLNGRRPQALIDPDVDLMQIRDGLALADWILPAPSTPPIHLHAYGTR